MQAIRFDRCGEPDVLELVDAATPSPGPGEVLVRVESAGVNYADTARRRNMYLQRTPLPFVLGGEVAGTVEALGSGVSQPVAGSKVVGVIASGAYAQFAVLPASQAVVLPPGVTPEVATALFVQGLSAWLIFTATVAPLRAAESVFIQGAAGGVGSLAVQIAKLLGAGRVIALASTAEKRAFALRLGADEAVDYTQNDWPARALEANGGRGADMILEIAGGEAVRRDLEALAPHGRVIVYGNASREATSIDPLALLNKNSAVIGFWLTPYFSEQPELIAAGLRTLFGWAANGELKPYIGHRFALRDAAAAHAQLEARETMGKIVLKPWE